MIKPLGNNVLLQKIKKDNTTKSGIILQTAGVEDTIQAVVVRAAQDVTEVKSGDTVLYNKHNVTPIKHNDVDYLLINSKDIMAVVVNN